MLRPNKDKTKKPKLTKESIKKAKGIFTYLRPYRFTFMIGWIFLILSSSVGLLFPYLMGELLGSPNNSASSNGDTISLMSLDNINSIALALFLLFATQSIFSFFRVDCEIGHQGHIGLPLPLQPLNLGPEPKLLGWDSFHFQLNY